MAGPDKPPLTLLRTGIWVSASIAMAFTVFMAVKASAPALTAVLAISVMSATLGDSFTITGFRVAALTLATTSAKSFGFCPISEPVYFTCGHETLSSMASAPASAAFRATVAYSCAV